MKKRMERVDWKKHYPGIRKMKEDTLTNTHTLKCTHAHTHTRTNKHTNAYHTHTHTLRNTQILTTSNTLTIAIKSKLLCLGLLKVAYNGTIQKTPD